nr:hypothetical protein [Tanacetum cinerariifolium]
MTGVPKRVIKHSLSVDPLERPVSQKRRVFCPDKTRAITKEVDEWLRAGIVRPVKYPTWISNPVLVKKTDGSCRMCIDFKNVNATCPKDYYPLPEIDSKIEVVMGFPLKCFLDAYKGATYQRLVDGAFKTQIGRNLKAYVDDMVIKSKYEMEMLADIAEIFDNLGRINTKLNSKKCSFGVAEGMFLGYMVTSEGIRANPAKTKDIAEMQSPRTWGEMQSLAGKLAALNRFLSRKGEKCIPRSQEDDFRPTGSNNALPKRNFVCVLSDIKRGNKCSAIGGKARKATSGTLYQSIKQIMSKADTSGQLAPYVVELGAYNITYEPRNAIKGQVLADFINEIPVGSNAIAPLRSHCEINQQKDCKEEWTLYTDGAASAKGFDASLAEYEALLAGLRIAKKMGVESLSVKVDSKLVASQINEMLDVPSMDVQEINTVVEEEGETWMTPIINCLERGTWPEDQNEARALRMKISQYVMKEGVLFKRSYLMPMLWCVGPLHANYVREIHMGACSMHLKARSVAAKAIRQEYYWPAMHRDAREVIRKCDSCQIHSPIPKLPKTLMTSIMTSWSFFQWGMDVLGPLTKALGKVRFVFVAVNYFTK